MNFVAQVEESLRDLGSQAKKKHPGVKEASERAILQLRLLQTKYVSAVRQSASVSTKHPTTAIFQSQDILRPFLLCANYPDVNYALLSLVLQTIQMLSGGNAICKEDSVHIVRVLCIQANICCASLGGCSNANNGANVTSTNSMAGNPSNQSSIGIGSSIITGILGGVGRAMIAGSSSSNDSVTNDAGMFMSGGYSSSSGSISTRSVKEDEALAIRILQTLTMVVDARELELSQEVLSQCIAVCLVFIHNVAATSGGGGTVSGSSMSSNGDVHGANSKSKGNFVDSTVSSARKVRRASIATLRQIISILFDRAATLASVSDLDKNDNDETNVGTREIDDQKSDTEEQSSMHLDTSHVNDPIIPLAYRTFHDLCIFAEKESNDMVKDTTANTSPIGPFTQALHGGGMGSYQLRVRPPPRSACFDLIEMILRQHEKLFTTFTTKDGTYGVNDADLMEFPLLLKNYACPLLSNTLTSEFVFDLNRTSRFESENGASNQIQDIQIDTNNPASFSLLLILIKLASTVITIYGPIDFGLKVAIDDDSESFILGECHVLLVSLVKFVKAVTEVYKDSYDFEDGSMYSTETDDHGQNKADSFGQTTQRRKRLRLGFASSLLMWRAAISIEFFYYLVSEHFKTLTSINFTSSKENNSADGLLAIMAEAVSDFAIVASSNTVGISQVVDAVNKKGDQCNNTIQPMISTRARDATKSFNEWDSLEYILRGSGLREESGDVRPSLDETILPVCDVGEAVWVSFHFIFSMWLNFTPLKSPEGVQDEDMLNCLVDKSFGSSIVTFQHFLKRFPGSKVISEFAVRGYGLIANSTLSMTPSSQKKLQRRTILTSLCNLSLPTAENAETVSQLSDRHITSLSSLFGIIHTNHDDIGEDWDIILCAYDHLSMFSTAPSTSSMKTKSMMESLVTCFCRIGTFTTCFQKETLVEFIYAVISTSSTALTAESLNKETSMGESETVKTDSSDKEFFGGKILNFASRALIGGLSARDEDDELDGGTHHQALTSKLFMDSFIEPLYSKLAATKPVTPMEHMRSIPLVLLLLADVCIENIFRFEATGERIMTHLCELAISSQPLRDRLFVMDVFAYLITNLLGSDKEEQTNQRKNYSCKEAAGIEDFFGVVSDIETKATCRQEKLSQNVLLMPLCRTITRTSDHEIAEAGISTLLVIIDGSGHCLLDEAWVVIIEAISTIAGPEDGLTLTSDRSSSDWSTCCTLAFRCLKLIVDDFLDVLPESIESKLNPSKSALLECCAAFGRSNYDLNTSLTATGMLWTIADQDSTHASLNSVLSKLAMLCSDDRPEVRNCSVNTFFSCVVGLGQTFNSEQWQLCFNKTMFSVLDNITSHNFAENSMINLNQDSKLGHNDGSRYKVIYHHTRDSSSKQWATTTILALRGVERVLRQYFDSLVRFSGTNKDDPNEYWFMSAWSYILDLGLQCSVQIGGRDTLDLRTSGIDLVILCCQVSSALGIVSSNEAGRVGTNMKVINGALRPVRVANDTKKENVDVDLDESLLLSMKSLRKELFKMAFDAFIKFHQCIDNKNLYEEHELESPMYSETTYMQVMTKLSQGLSKLYDSCKDNELQPSLLTQRGNSNNAAEKEFVDLVRSIMKSTGVSDSKYLSQSQRICLELLQTMASSSSSIAFDVLIQTCGTTLFSHSDTEMVDRAVEEGSVLGTEAAKIVADKCSDSNAAKTSVVHITCMFIDSYLIQHKNEPRCQLNHAQYVVPIVCGGMNALHMIELSMHNDEVSKDDFTLFESTTTDDVWSKVLVLIRFFFIGCVCDIGHDQAARIGDDVLLLILNECLNFLPHRFYPELGSILSTVVQDALKCLLETQSQDIDVDQRESHQGMVESVLKLFDDGYKGLCKITPENELPCQIAREVFGKALQGEMTSTIIALSTSICRALKGSQNSYSTAAELHPYLCSFISCEDKSLRKEASEVIAIINISDLLQRTRTAEEHLNNTKKELEETIQYLHLERERVHFTQSKLDEMKLQETKLLDEIGMLRKKNEQLEQQVVNTSENFTYT